MNSKFQNNIQLVNRDNKVHINNYTIINSTKGYKLQVTMDIEWSLRFGAQIKAKKNSQDLNFDSTLKNK
jgi:hypothetical protein